jgi:uncharacterized integral membrane protein
MSVHLTHKHRNAARDETATSHEPGTGARQPTDSHSVPRTRTGSAWVGLGTAALVAVALVVFMLQNTARVDISFLWMTGRLPLGLILFIAVLGSILLTVTLGTARILQLRRFVGREGRRADAREGRGPSGSRRT